MADEDATITQKLAEKLRYGQSVLDNGGNKIGTVDDVDPNSGWIRTQTSPLSDTAIYIPFNMVTSVDPREIFVSRSREELRRDYGDPPARAIHIEQVDGQTIATTREPNGFDGSSTVVHTVNIDEVRKQIGEGYSVLSSEHVGLGTIKRYDRTTGWILIHQAVPPHELLVPVTSVERVDLQYGEVHLVLSEADLRRMQHLEPVDVIFIDTQPVNAVELQAQTQE